MHSLVRIGPRWFALLSAGAEKEIGGHASGTGIGAAVAADVDSTLGLTGEGGLYCRFDHAAFGGSLRYTAMHAWFQGFKVDDSSLGVVASGQYSF